MRARLRRRHRVFLGEADNVFLSRFGVLERLVWNRGPVGAWFPQTVHERKFPGNAQPTCPLTTW